MLVYWLVTSIETRTVFSSTFVFSMKLMKSVVFLRAIVQKFRLEVCKMKKSKIPKLCQNIGLDELFLKKVL